ncbi:MAG: hypothetical protein KH704_09615 [Clostridiales bacterium]|nr:hypothetical protein [Clostridiales bacterium]
MKTYRHPLILVLAVLAVLMLVLLLRPRRLSSVLPDGESEITFCKVLLLSGSAEIGELTCSPEQIQSLEEALPQTWVRWVSPWAGGFRAYDERAYHLVLATENTSYSMILSDRGELVCGRAVYRTCFDDGLFRLIQSWTADQE